MSENDETNESTKEQNIVEFGLKPETPFESVPEASKSLTERVMQELEEIQVMADRLETMLYDLHKMVYSGARDVTQEIRLCGMAVDGMAMYIASKFELNH